MSNILRVVILFLVINASLRTKAQKPEKLGTCKVKLADGRFINLKPLDNPNSPRVAAYNGYNYKFNPCSGITCGTVPSVSVCQVGIANPQFIFNCGDENSVEFDYSSSLVMTFKGTQAGVLRTSRVQCVCDQTGPESYIVNENPPNFYNIEFKSKCCCPSTSENGNCGSGPGPKPSGNGGSLSGGWILIIIAICLSAVYLIGGMLYMAMVKKNSGIQIVPNLTFWSELPGNIKAGFTFVIGKLKGGSGGYQSV